MSWTRVLKLVDSLLLRFSRCETLVYSEAEIVVREAASGRIVIVRRPAGWTPAGELDAPERAEVLEVVDEPVFDPPTFIRHFNAGSLDEGGCLWAALARSVPTTGQMVELLRPRLESPPSG